MSRPPAERVVLIISDDGFTYNFLRKINVRWVDVGRIGAHKADFGGDQILVYHKQQKRTLTIMPNLFKADSAELLDALHAAWVKATGAQPLPLARGGVPSAPGANAPEDLVIKVNRVTLFKDVLGALFACAIFGFISQLLIKVGNLSIAEPIVLIWVILFGVSAILLINSLVILLKAPPALVIGREGLPLKPEKMASSYPGRKSRK